LFDLRFTVTERFRPFALTAPGLDRTDSPPLDALTRLGQGRVSESARRDLVLGGDGLDLRLLTQQSPAAPYAAVEMRVERQPEGSVTAGLFTGEADHVLVSYDRTLGKVAIEARVGGATHTVASTDLELPAAYRLGFALCENRVTALVGDAGHGWAPVLTERQRVADLVDLRDPAVLSRYRYGWGARSPGEVVIGQRAAGHFGMAGLRDPHLVQHGDGSPYRPDGRYYLTFTCAGLGFFRQAHWGVFAFDPDHPTALEQVSAVFFHRDGLVLGDHAGQIVRDDENDRFLVMVSSWGDFDFSGVHVRHTTTDRDLLSGVHVLPSEPLALPTSVSAWDPALTRIARRWHVGFVESPSQRPFRFHPALAVGEAGRGYGDGLTLVGRDDTLRQCEGVVLSAVDGEWFVLASDKDSRRYPVYDLGMRRLGSLDAPYLTNIPHPQLVPVGDGAQPRLLLVTFDGTQYAEDVLGYGGHGDVVIMTGAAAPAPRQRGRQPGRRLGSRLSGLRPRPRRRHPRLSVVVPVYNVQRYLAECLDSILGQEFQDLEVVIVDDGSTDESAALAQRYADTDDRLRLVRTANEGPSGARNTGIQHARGELLTFVDSDDTIPRHAHALLVSTLDESGSDFAVGSLVRPSAGRPSAGWQSSTGAEAGAVEPPWVRGLHARRRLGITVDDFPPIMRDIFVWNKVFRRSFWESAGLRFPAGRRYEDQVTITEAYLKAAALDIVCRPVYSWRIRPDGSSITQRRHELADLQDRLATKAMATRLVTELGSPAVQDLWFRQGLVGDLPLYFRQIRSCDDRYWQTLHTGLAHLLDGRPGIEDSNLGAAQRLVGWLVVHGRRADAETVLDYVDRHPNGFGSDVRAGRVLARLPLRDDPDSGVPENAFVLRDHEAASGLGAGGAAAVGDDGRGETTPA
jgi:glycosyltransferase involved in cell wall biosynthesis